MKFDSLDVESCLLTQQLVNEFQEQFGQPATQIARAPGRVNLIGEHTDYNLGLVLPMAIDRQVVICFTPREDKQVHLYSKNYEQWSRFSLEENISKDDTCNWCDYIKGVADVLIRNGHELQGFDGLIFGDVPLASGLSSSAAIEVAAVLAFSGSSGIQLSGPLEIAQLAQRAEQEFVGVNCGLMDQFISAAAIEGHALKIRCDTMEFEPISIPDNAVIIVGDTKLSRSLAASAYNERREECDQALSLIQEQLGGEQVPTMGDVSNAVVEASQIFLPDTLYRRCHHVASENQRVMAAANALMEDDLVTAGALFNASHASLRNDYEVSSEGLDTMVECMRQLSGCYGARLTGAGFGGCAIALVDESQHVDFVDQLPEAYFQATGIRADVFQTRASSGGRLSSR